MKQTDPIAPGHVYGCHSDHTGDAPRGGSSTAFVPDGHRTLMKDGILIRQQKVGTHTTHWAEIDCGHNLRISDPSCTGCARRGQE